MAIVIVLLGAAIWYYYAMTGAGPAGNASPSAPVAGAGQRCGGNIVNAPVCATGYQCEPNPSSTAPFGDVGGVCVAVQVQGSY